MVLWLPFDETVGPTSANLAAPGNPGTQVGGPTVVLGAYVDNSLAFNGFNQYVSVPDYPAIDIGTGNLTIDAWVLRSPNDADSPPSVIVDKRDVNTGIGYALSLSYGELILTLPASNYRDTKGFVPPDGQWHFVAVVLIQASTPPSIQFYVDTGPTATATPVPGNLANTHDLWVAASPLGGNQPWLGNLDEVEVYDRALANSELAAIYNAGVAGKCKPCTGISVICPPDKTVPCGSAWTFDPPTASSCCTNQPWPPPDQRAHHLDRHCDQRRLPAGRHHPNLADYRRLRRQHQLQPDGDGYRVLCDQLFAGSVPDATRRCRAAPPGPLTRRRPPVAAPAT